MKKKICSLLLALLMVVTMLPVTAMASNSYYINGKTVHYDDFASSPNECWVYANNIYNKIWGQRFSNDFGDANNSLRNLSDSELTLTSAHLKAYVSNAKLGAVLRICNSEYLHGSDGWGHSQIIVQKDSNGFTVFEGGLSASPYCREKYYTWGGYLNSYSYAYIKYIKWPGASAYVDSHTCDKGSYVYYEAAHPHYKCYKCSICGKVWRDTSAPTKLTNCEQCYPRTATVTYYNADGAVWTTASGTADTSYTLNASYPTKSGSYFVGWSYTAGTSSFDLRPNDTVTLKGSIDLYPVYVTHEEAVSGEEVYIYDINDFDSEGYNISSEDHTVQTRVDNSGWTSWSNYSLTAATESATQQVRTTKMYRYYYFLCPSCGRHEPFTGKSDCGATISGGAWHEGWFDTPYSACNPQSFSYTTSKYYTTSLGDGQVWIFSAGNLNDTSVGTTDATGSASVIETGYSTRQWVTKFNTVDRTATAYRITKAALASGTCGENLTWILDENGTLTISGTGAMTSPVWWNSYKDSIKTVVIKDGVTTIEEGAFEDCENLTSITIPASVTNIGEDVFSGCSTLARIEVDSENQNYTSLDGVLFSKDLIKIIRYPEGRSGDYTIPSNVTSIGNFAFKGCAGLTNVIIPNGVTSIGELAFSGCKNLSVVTIPDSVNNIGFYAFSNCKALSSVTLPDGLMSIKGSTFNECSNLISIKIPNSVTQIGWAAFSGCSNLTDVYYDGTEEQWKQVKIDNGNDANYLLNAATIHFKEPEPQPPVETSGTIAVSSVRARAGQTVTVKVDLSANKGISNMRLQMSYPEGFTLERIQRGGGLSTLFFTPPGKLTANPVNFLWDGTEADTSEGCILELTFRIADTVAVGEYSISLSYQKDDVLDGSLEGIDLALQSGTVSVVEFTRGDIDGDGVIGMKDLGALRKYFAGGYDTEKFVMEAADLDGDGVVTMKDLGVLRRYLAGGYDINLGE
ncbi:leucine-rich repeat protein [Vescimonas sp.]|uniref:leucine-rich repeat protein n=1 Tax=Vescimonas sp. TaxID=2892404 RepID=UPI00307B67CE